jgi:hypothetical protein
MRRSMVFGLVTALALASCITPSIPIPPPDPVEMTFHITVVNTSSTATFTYPSDNNYCGGVAYLNDRNLGGGIFHNVNADCSVGPMTLSASLGDAIDVTVQAHVQTVSTCIRLREGTQSPFDYCP